MQPRSSSSRKDIWSLFLSYTLLGILLSVSGCARALNTVPDGYIGLINKHPFVASTMAQFDYAVVVEPNPYDPAGLDNPSSIGIHVTKYGERYWIFDSEYWDQELWKPITWYRFSLIEDGVTNAICTTGLLKQLEGDVWSVPCTSYTYHTFKQSFMVNDHRCKNLIGMLDYWVGGNAKDPPEGNVPATATVTRPYYIIIDPEKK